MKKFLQKKFHKKSESEKKRIATLFAGLTTGIIVLVWLGILIFLRNPQDSPQENQFDDFIAEIKNRGEHALGDLSNQKDYFNDQKDQILEQAAELESQNQNNSAKEAFQIDFRSVDSLPSEQVQEPQTQDEDLITQEHNSRELLEN